MTTTLQEPVTLDPHRAGYPSAREKLAAEFGIDLEKDPVSDNALMAIAAVKIQHMKQDLAETQCIESISTRNGRITRIDLVSHEFRGVKDAIREHQAALGRPRGLLPIKGMECVADCGDYDVDTPVGEAFEQH